ncbi:MAG: ABC transporter permease subunit [Candidatus Poribacteria bacterium]|nr:ABC transporter permease subunit [Candidatus Poribacteria bacterium]
MPIHTQNYRHWEGTLKTHSHTRWWIIAKAELKLLAQRKIVRLIVAIPPLMYIFAHAVLIYIINQVPGVEFAFIKVDGEFFQKFLFRISPFPSPFIVALVAIFGGSGLIATDLKNNTLSLYLSKPISWIDYLIGKFAAIGILLACLTLVPGLLLFLEQSLFAGTAFLKDNYWVPFSIIAYSLIIVLSTGLLILVFSSLTTNARYAIIGFSAVWFGSIVLYEVLKEMARTSKVALVSIWANYDILGTALFGGSPDYSVHWIWALLIQIVLIVFYLFVLRRRIRAVEVVK